MNSTSIPTHDSPDEAATVESQRLMAELSITHGGWYYHYDGYRYERLADAAAYARLVRARKSQQPHPSAQPDPSLLAKFDAVESPDESDRQLMLELSISFENGSQLYLRRLPLRPSDRRGELRTPWSTAQRENTLRSRALLRADAEPGVARPTVSLEASVGRRTADKPVWKSMVAKYQQPSAKCALWQLTNTFVPYVLLWYAMYHALQVSFWLTVPLALLSGALLVRIFIIFHDCAHGSYFNSRRANEIVGCIAGVLTFTPYSHWRWEHAIHHASAGDLDRRGTGDVWTMTVQEYLAASRRRRLAYRLVRNPPILFVLAPLFVFVIKQRFASAKAGRRQRRSVCLTNVALLCMVAIFVWIFGIAPYVLIQSIALTLAGAAGLWLFYVQHQFEDVYWERGERRDHVAAALRGSSFYKLPRILQWFSGNIGFHHIHHLGPRIPNYNLQKCHESDRLFEQVKPITLGSSLKCLTFRFWDEQGRKLVGHAYMRQLKKKQHACARGRHQG